MVLGYHNQMNTEMTNWKHSWTCNLPPQFHWNIPFYPQYWITWLYNKCNPKTPLRSFSSQTEGLRKEWMNRVLNFNSVDTHSKVREQHWNIIVQRQFLEHQWRGFLFFLKHKLFYPMSGGRRGGEEIQSHLLEGLKNNILSSHTWFFFILPFLPNPAFGIPPLSM